MTLLANAVIAAAGWFGSNSQKTWHWLSLDDVDRRATNANIVLQTNKQKQNWFISKNVDEKKKKKLF